MIEQSTWFKAIRGQEAIELIKANPNAFILLYIIATRAKRTDGFNALGLTTGEAAIGDYEECGLTEQNYRTAKKFLGKWNFATFRPTNKGTIAKLINTRVFDINEESPNGQTNGRVTDSQRTGNGRVTTNKNDKKEKNGNNVKKLLAD